MQKITEFYLNKASYLAVDEQGKEFNLDVNYWEKSFSLQPDNQELQEYAAKLLNKKHRINFVYKMKREWGWL